MAFDISFAGATEYTPYEGGSDVYPFDGLTFGDIVKIEEGDSKTGNKMLIFTLACAEEEAKGLKVKKWVPVTGTRSDGKPNVLGLLDVVASVHSESLTTEAAIAKSRALDGQQLNSAILIQQLTGKRVHYEVRARAFQRDDGTSGVNSECSNFVMKQKYIDAKAINSHHRPVDMTSLKAAPRATYGALGIGIGTANGASAPSTQPASAKPSPIGIL